MPEADEEPAPASVVAVVLAAGRGQRMGDQGSKAFLALPAGETCLERIAGTCRAAGVGATICVLSEDPPPGRSIPAGVDVVFNHEPDRGMVSSLWVALDDPRLAQASGLIMWPVDCPRVPASVIRGLLQAADDGAPLAVPSHAGRRGHPTYFGRALFGELRSEAAAGGARAVVRRHADRIAYVSTDDPSVCGIDLEHEHRLAYTELGFSASDLTFMTFNAARSAFLPPAERAARHGL